MATAPGSDRPHDIPQRLLFAASELLADQGPSAIKARTVASAAGLSTMVVYSHFGGVPELMCALIDHGFKVLDQAFDSLPISGDPVSDLAVMALTCRQIARANPHLYDLMFGLSTRSTYRPVSDATARLHGRSQAFLAAYAHVEKACTRLVDSGRVRPGDPGDIGAQLWSFVHGFITLELAQTFADRNDPVAEVLIPLGINFFVGLGDKRRRAVVSHETAWHTYCAAADAGGRVS